MNAVPFRFYLVSHRFRMGADPAGTVAELVRAGLTAFQWREKDLSPAENLGWLRAIAESGRLSLFVNDRADLALAAGCHLHLAESSIPTREARSLLPAERLIGRSTHSLDGALKAAREGADFITFGPVYETGSKLVYGSPQGLARLREICAAVTLPVFAIGGVTPVRVAECREAGAFGVAVIGTVWESSDPVAGLRACLDALSAT
jgi:thiamine-phosphate pyrophosphorylase